MILSEYIAALQTLAEKHGGNLRVTMYNQDGVVTASMPEFGHIRENTGRERRVRYWTSYYQAERAKIEDVIKL